MLHEPARASSAWNLQRATALSAHAPLILGGALLLALLTYGVLARQAPRYQALSSLLAAPGEATGALLTTAPALPGGALEQALRSPVLVQDMTTRLRGSGLDTASVDRIAAELRQELSEQDFARLSVQSQLDEQQSGTYIIAAQGRSPQEAKLLADTAVDALLAWDQARAVQGITRLQRSLRSYLATLDRRLAATPDPGRRQALLQVRQGASDRLIQLEQVQGAASGTLSPLASAVAPARPISASPLRAAGLAFVLAGLLGTLLATLWPTPQRRGRQIQGIDELGWLPPCEGTELALTPEAGWPPALRRALSLLRGTLVERLPSGPGRVVLTASSPTSASSLVAALLARSLSESGRRVLLIDANLHAPAQHQLWRAWNAPSLLLPGASEGAPVAPTLAAALSAPEGAQARNVAPGVDLLGGPDAAPPTVTLAGVTQLDLLLARWGETYDLVLIDAPPLAHSRDAALLCGGRRSLLLLADDSQDRARSLTQGLSLLPDTGAGLLGVVWNNVPQAWRRALAPRLRAQEPSLRRPAQDPDGL